MLAEKNAKKAAAATKAAQASQASNKPPAKKKPADKQGDDLSALLTEGLKTAKKK